MAELVDATDLKSVGACPRAGSIPAFRTIKHPLTTKGVFTIPTFILKKDSYIDFFNLLYYNYLRFLK